MPPALIAGVAAVAGAGAGLIGASKNSKAIKQSTAAQQASEAQQIAYQREARAQNTAALSPFMARGNVAGETINAALGLGGNVPGQTVGPAGQNPATSAMAAYELFKSSTGYQTRLDEGYSALNAGYAGRGVLQSGAAVKSALRYGQEFASNEFGNWLGALGNQQGVGFAGASALAGVGQGFADRMGDISRNSADNASAAAIARAQNQGALWSGLAGAAGQVVGALSSYRQPQPMSGWGVPGLY